MEQEIAFLRTILEHPEKDGPRLVYADWLDEIGESARAEFIRVQIERTHVAQDSDRHRELFDREQKLLKRYWRRWQRRVGSWVRDCEFQRGIMEYARVTGASFSRFGKRLFERAAVLRLRLTDAGTAIARVARSPALQWLRELDVGYNRLGRAQLEVLLDSPYLSRLQSLDLSANPLSDRGVAVLTAATSLACLRRLVMARITLTAPDLERLGNANWPELSSLNISGAVRRPEDFSPLLVSPLARQLRTLTITHTPLESEGAIAIARSENLAQLVELDLAVTSCRSAGAIAIAASPQMASLEYLDLRGNGIGLDGARALAESRFLNDLKYLNLINNPIGRSGAEMLRRRFGDRVDGID